MFAAEGFFLLSTVVVLGLPKEEGQCRCIDCLWEIPVFYVASSTCLNALYNLGFSDHFCFHWSRFRVRINEARVTYFNVNGRSQRLIQSGHCWGTFD